jgi:indole-3-glycerol phosphate synthase
MTILDRISVYKREEISYAKAQLPEPALEELARKSDPPRRFRAALLACRAANRFGLVAEIKKASPSKGLIRADFDPASLARAYEAGGAACLSVLTDTPSFQGAPDHLRMAREAVRLPVLRKDFLFDPYQVTEARAWGADCVLVILSAVSDVEATQLIETAKRWKMDALIEIHDEAECDRALNLGADIIGINSRDLKTFTIDPDLPLRLAAVIPDDVLVVAESGLSLPAELRRLAEAGITTFLIGQSLMRQPDVTAATRALIGATLPP